ncbi:AraC family transcriptional regulator [Chitinophaga sp.]|uniref:helix-turn-helix domain-containing protein n=1 Tax=Chitinophaga sp. TaxID=1869181 RepID=UPI0031DA4BDE
MIARQTGQFYGQTNQCLQQNGLTLTDTEYTLPEVDWHYHENAYFTFILQGHVIEGNKREIYHCSPGDLLFHHWQDAHYNIKPPGFTRGFHIEINPGWFAQYDLPDNLIEGSVRLKDPRQKLQMYRIFRESKEQDCSAAIDTLLIELFTTTGVVPANLPAWVKRLDALLHDDKESHLYTLKELATAVQVHPVHLSRTFPVYFKARLSDYQRQLKLQKALSLMGDKNHTLSSIAAACGFADQSHFIRQFKQVQQMTPLAYRKMLTGFYF